METIIKADTKLTVVMCCHFFWIEVRSAFWRRFPAAVVAVAALLTEPQTAAGVVYFLQIQHVYVLFNKKQKRTIFGFLVSFTTTFFLTVFTPHFCKKNTFEIIKHNL